MNLVDIRDAEQHAVDRGSVRCRARRRTQDYFDLRAQAVSEPPSRRGPTFTAAKKLLHRLGALTGDGGVCAPPQDIIAQALAHLELFADAASGADIPEPWVAASQDGSIGIDWRYATRRLAITYDRNDGIEYFAEADGGAEFEGLVESSDEMKRLATWLATASGLSASSR